MKEKFYYLCSNVQLSLRLRKRKCLTRYVIFLLVLVAVEGFEAGSERIARSELIKRFERRMTKVTKYFDEV